MIGTLKPVGENKSVRIVGGGISGLVLGYRLKKIGYEVRIYEASDRPGGLIQSIHTVCGIFETAIHSFIRTPEIIAMSQELGLELIEKNPGARARFILIRGRLRRMPLSFIQIPGYLKNYFFKKVPAGIRTVGELTDSIFGSRFTDNLVDPALQGVFATEARKLSFRLAFPEYRLTVGKTLAWHRKTFKEKPTGPFKLVSYANGMAGLVNALGKNLKPELKLSTRVDSIRTWYEAGENVILAVPPRVAGKLLSEIFPAAGLAVQNIPMIPMTTCGIFLPKNALQTSPDGVGLLIPTTENVPDLLGVLFNSSSFPQKTKDPELWVSLTALFGGTRNQERWKKTPPETQEEALKAQVHQLLTRYYGLDVEKDYYSSFKHWSEALPFHGPELEAAHDHLLSITKHRQGLVIASNFTGEISVRKMIGGKLPLLQIEPPLRK